ncbi:MAG: Rrf2 family transcriptional regulator [Proteobacteria bacterium]|nr:Rrf2 family transcriptional regulator [Pseudomonadota bacterium]
MLSINTKTKYGILAVIELAKDYNRGLLKIKDIVGRANIPKNFLEQIFNQLQKQGVIKSTRGNRGGYELAEDPANVSLLDVIEALEGETKMNGFQGLKPVEDILSEIVHQTKKTLDVPLLEIVRRQEELDQILMFSI